MKKIGFAIMIISLFLGFIQGLLPDEYFYQDNREILIFILWASFLAGLHMIIQQRENDRIKPRK